MLISSTLVPTAGDSTAEYSSADCSGTDADADAFDTHMQAQTDWYGRGAARNAGNGLAYPAVNLDFMKAAGVELICVKWPPGGTPTILDTAWVKNQADWFYFSGHGSHASGKLKMCDGSFSFGYQEAGGGNWDSGDIDRAIMAGCSVLDIRDHNNNYAGSDHTVSPGEDWETLGLAKMLGYNYGAPGDPTDQHIADEWLDGPQSVESWLDVNGDHSAWNARVIYTSDSDRAYRFWKYDRDFLGRIVNEHKVTTCKSQGWALP
ncbi:MAG: hypothetical protein ACE149_18245 [Armatimonadota bacterium]